METNHAVGNGYRGDDLNQLIAELCGIRSEMVRIETFFEEKTQQVHEKHKKVQEIFSIILRYGSETSVRSSKRSPAMGFRRWEGPNRMSWIISTQS